jgi:hypothetical protein
MYCICGAARRRRIQRLKAKGLVEETHKDVEEENEEFKKKKHIGHFCLNMVYFMTCGTVKCKWEKCCKQKKNLDSNARHLDDYTEGESETEFETPFNDLATEEKKTRILFLWKKAFNRARGGVLIVNKLLFQRKKIALYGDVFIPKNDAD